MRLLEQMDIANVLFLDIECVSGNPRFDELSPTLQELWQAKARSVLRVPAEELTEEMAVQAYEDKAAIFAEFGQVVCISVGIVVRDQQNRLSLRLKSFADPEEVVVLEAFNKLVEQYYNNPDTHYFCGHNIKEFDIPYLCRRMLINQLSLPFPLDLAGKKPWETKHLLDTMELWKFGDRKNFTSLKLLAAVFGFPSPKDDIDGSDVGRVFWQENDLDRIALYCEKDVLATVQLFLKYKRLPLLEEDQVIHVDRG